MAASNRGSRPGAYRLVIFNRQTGYWELTIEAMEIGRRDWPAVQEWARRNPGSVIVYEG